MQFHKMHGLGNDFIIMPASELLTRARITHLCSRHLGVGADQLITFTDEATPKARFYNQDGSEAEQCGNGIRCLAWLLMKQRGVDSITLQSPIGKQQAWLLKDDTVRIEMGTPEFTWEDLPISQQLDLLDVFVESAEKPDMVAVSMGNPHAVVFIPHPTLKMAEAYGPIVENHKLFPNKTNVHFVELEGDFTINMIPWERGTGITQACGSGACAVHAAALKKGLIGPKCKVVMPGGVAMLETRAEDGVILLTASATYVFEGFIKTL